MKPEELTIEHLKGLYPGAYLYEDRISVCDYSPLDTLLGEVLVTVSDNDYQGSTHVLLRSEDGKYGYKSYWWGSCSGCDAMQACDTWEDLLKYAGVHLSGVTWHDTIAGVLGAMEKPDEFSCDEYVDFYRKVKAMANPHRPVKTMKTV